MSNLTLPDGMNAPQISKTFLEQLRHIDSGLVIYWNRFRHRFVIDRCTNSDPHTHGVSCARANVLIVEDPEHGFMMPNDRVLDRIKAMDAWKKYGSPDEGGLERQRKARENAKAEYDARQKEVARENYRHGMLDDRVQINKALSLIQQHDVARVHK